MAETQQVRNSSNKEESPEPETSRSRRRFKASNMAFVEMEEMVDILKRADNDGKYGTYLNPNVRKAKIMSKVEKSAQEFWGTTIQGAIEETWSDLKLREQDQYRRIKKVLLKSDVHVVEEQAPHFTSASVQILIQEIMVCSRDLDIIKQNTNVVELKNMIDVLGRI
ncbi:hypothetical protein AB205_0163500 [Aquarana catesbeiana]|uniref:Uncharacterized protein n=1 Tax=Aquarana catesbeiana TaxID=8400 RepID=A0A2G9RTB8_AQUCT|nr:hypothetical protein AB205_0163500 [Aquarana catesbeiana]